jgi:hypothetical protein
MLVQTRRPTNLPNTEVGLGYFIRTGNSDEIIYKDGETGGYASFAGFSTKLRSGAVVLSNSANLVNDIGFRLTNPVYKIAQYPPEVSVDPKLLATYQGVYEMNPKFALTIRAEGAGSSRAEQDSPNSNYLPRARTASLCALSMHREHFYVTRMERSIGCCGIRMEGTRTVRAFLESGARHGRGIAAADPSTLEDLDRCGKPWPTESTGRALPVNG